MKLNCNIHLPASKSESNRALMIAAYGGFSADFQNLSYANDALVLMEALGKIKRNESIIDIADCGTAARFLTTFLACRKGNWILTGIERMKQRPIKPLVETLRNIGAKIQYVEKEGFLPLQIEGKTILGGKVALDITQSSQFASSLLLAAPIWRKGLELQLLGELNSLPYIDMTLSMMRRFGSDAERNGRKIVVKPKPYQSRSFKVSSDWSAASYWYEMAALSEECEIKLGGLSLPSLQGDAIIAEWMKLLGVSTYEENDALILRKSKAENQSLFFDFSNNPDLFPTMAATCAGLQLDARFSGVANLRIKESDRVEAMKTELVKIGAELVPVSDNEVFLHSSNQLPFVEKSSPLQFASHNDHRIVMALAPLSMKLGCLVFDHPKVVEKSYPDFWSDTTFLQIIR